MKAGSWSTLSFGAEREALEDPELFAIISGRREPVEVTDPASNPALAHSRLARSNLGIRWLLGVPLLGPTGEVNAIFAVLDTEPRDLSRARTCRNGRDRAVSSPVPCPHTGAWTSFLGLRPRLSTPMASSRPPTATRSFAATKWRRCSM